MTKVQYFTACSLDGFIADEHHALDWLYAVPHDVDDGYWDAFIVDVGPLVMGATTYEHMLREHDMVAHPQQWHDFYDDRPAFVFTHRELPPIPGVDVTFVQGDVASAYDAIVAKAAGKNVWVLGGGDLVGQFADAGRLDEIILGMAPVTLGGGDPLLPRRITSERLRLQRAEQIGQRLRVVLEVSPPR